ncbi:MAG: hypothetical protein KJ970_00810 [Candidatus Eisenbacteria bacterium]|uniref:Uncharacterized protein n=1 Tax=Eiseniibacteriota bacterium TaxID=2212470 RepID=A0A948W5C2_UNCEI|nr:hypothetical protein [Candidatus Eisenbacteria bacterium]MBU1949216.1 hypothetical protein [Candidatus Eisenbacteria bacterium]MBU2689441.1 hypothetical protein [Candidatus Eisenbacteria bacterium]
MICKRMNLLVLFLMLQGPAAGESPDDDSFTPLSANIWEARSSIEQWSETYDSSPHEAVFNGIHIINETFQMVFSGDKDDTKLILQQSLEIKYGAPPDPQLSKITVQAWPLGAALSDQPLYKYTAYGFEGEPYRDMYRIRDGGHCSNVITETYFSLSTGEALFETRAPLLQINTLDNQLRRYITFNRAPARSRNQSPTRPPAHPKGRPPAQPTVVTLTRDFGVLELIGGASPGSKLMIILPWRYNYELRSLYFCGNGIPAGSQTLALYEAQSPQQIGGFTIAVEISRWPSGPSFHSSPYEPIPPLKFEIPIMADQFAPDLVVTDEEILLSLLDVDEDSYR